MPIVCDMTGAPDTAEERIVETSADRSGVDRSPTHRGRHPGPLRCRTCFRGWVADLAARDKACCAFCNLAITRHDNETLSDASVVDNDTARTIFEESYNRMLWMTGLGEEGGVPFRT
jgi:hypothetical protein